jgi:hypothetical protein
MPSWHGAHLKHRDKFTFTIIVLVAGRMFLLLKDNFFRARTDVCVCVCVYICIYTHAHTYIHTYIHNTYIHTYIHEITILTNYSFSIRKDNRLYLM